MALQKPKIATCIDSKGHSWLVVAEEEPTANNPNHLEHRWCKKCGCLTQVGFLENGEYVAAVDESGQAHIAVPKILNLLIK